MFVIAHTRSPLLILPYSQIGPFKYGTFLHGVFSTAYSITMHPVLGSSSVHIAFHFRIRRLGMHYLNAQRHRV